MATDMRCIDRAPVRARLLHGCDRLTATVERQPRLLLALIALLYAGAALASIKPRHLIHPGDVHWAGWSDQRLYLVSARAFAAFDFNPAHHWYPLLYSLLAAPFAWFAGPLSFLPVDFCCYLIAFVGFCRVARHFGVSRLGAALLFPASTILYPTIGKRWAEPWTTTPSAALIWLALALALPLLARPVPPVGALKNRRP